MIKTEGLNTFGFLCFFSEKSKAHIAGKSEILYDFK